jgi:hypothetical protein
MDISSADSSGNRPLAVAGRVVELVSRVELGVQLVRLVRRRLEPEGLKAVAWLVADALRLQRPGERIGVVLEHDRAQRLTRSRVGQHDPAAGDLGRIRHRGHGALPYRLLTRRNT